MFRQPIRSFISFSIALLIFGCTGSDTDVYDQYKEQLSTIRTAEPIEDIKSTYEVVLNDNELLFQRFATITLAAQVGAFFNELESSVSTESNLSLRTVNNIYWEENRETLHLAVTDNCLVGTSITQYLKLPTNREGYDSEIKAYVNNNKCLFKVADPYVSTDEYYQESNGEYSIHAYVKGDSSEGSSAYDNADELHAVTNFRDYAVTYFDVLGSVTKEFYYNGTIEITKTDDSMLVKASLDLTHDSGIEPSIVRLETLNQVELHPYGNNWYFSTGRWSISGANNTKLITEIQEEGFEFIDVDGNFSFFSYDYTEQLYLDRVEPRGDIGNTEVDAEKILLTSDTDTEEEEIFTGNDTDLYKLSAIKSGYYSLNAAAILTPDEQSSLQLIGILYSQHGEVLASNLNSEKKDSFYFHQYFDTETDYYLLIKSDGGSYGEYKITYQDRYIEDIEGDSFTSAYVLDFNDNYEFLATSSVYEEKRDFDYYKLIADSGNVVHIEISCFDDLYVKLVKDTGDALQPIYYKTFSNSFSDEVKISDIVFEATDEQLYMETQCSGSDTYPISFYYDPDIDVGDTADEARTLYVNGSEWISDTSYSVSQDDIDFYRLSVDEAGTYDILTTQLFSLMDDSLNAVELLLESPYKVRANLEQKEYYLQFGLTGQNRSMSDDYTLSIGPVFDLNDNSIETATLIELDDNGYYEETFQISSFSDYQNVDENYHEIIVKEDGEYKITIQALNETDIFWGLFWGNIMISFFGDELLESEAYTQHLNIYSENYSESIISYLYTDPDSPYYLNVNDNSDHMNYFDYKVTIEPFLSN